jgi:tripartite-type tricarboxylate transporter receptor subunit TctC
MASKSKKPIGEKFRCRVVGTTEERLMRYRISAGGVAALLACTTAALALSAPAAAQDFYEGKQIRLVVGVEAGPGYDAYARFVARHMVRFIPGKPAIIVQNMPGAGTSKAAEYIYTLAPKDGTVFGMIFPGTILEPLSAEPGKYRFDPARFTYVGSADSGVRMCITYKTSKIKTFKDALEMPSIFGGAQPGAAITDYAQMMVNLAGAKFKIVNGYRSSLPTMLAMERGEIDGVCGLDVSSLRAMRPTWIDNREVNLLVQAALEPRRDLLESGVPSLWDYITGDNRKTAEIVVAQQEFQRPFIAPPEMPAERLAVLRKAFMAALADPATLAEADKMGLTIGPKDGESVAALVKQLYAASPEQIERLRKALRP